MRRFEPNRFSVIIPVHIANRLGFMSRDTAASLRTQLDAVAERASGPSGSGALHLSSIQTHLYVEADGVRLRYQVDQKNRTVLAIGFEEVSRR
jgi:hypothetical protein